jgi:uncharacterized protein
VERRRKIAVVGSGIAGLSAAWMLNPRHDVTLFESAPHIGGHSHTVDVPHGGRVVAVDTGFIVYNVVNYPNLVALLDHLGVATTDTEMSFAVSLDDGAFEYGSTGLPALFAQKRNLLRPRFWSMLGGIRRFYRDAERDLARGALCNLSLGDYLATRRASSAFVEDHLLPQAGAIWSASRRQIRDYPAESLVRFFANHQLLQIGGRARWRTIVGGSRSYVTRMAAGLDVHVDTAVATVRRNPHGVELRFANGGAALFDDVVIATHADTALALLDAPSDTERKLLGAFSYAPSEAVLHSDPAVMPRRRSAWSSWNYCGRRDAPDAGSVNYWMNRLQPLGDAPPLFLTLNPARTPAHIHHRQYVTHPLFNARALAAQADLWRLQGRGGVWFAGAHFGAGFHEDGLQAGLAVAEALGGERRPWTVARESGRIMLPVAA